MKVCSLVVCWGLIVLYFSKIIEETSHFSQVLEVVYYTIIGAMALVFWGGLKFSGWILSRKGDTEEETEVEEIEQQEEELKKTVA